MRSVEYRKSLLQGIIQFCTEQEDALNEAAYKDLKRHKVETMIVDCTAIQLQASDVIKKLDSWVKPTYPNAGWFSKGNVVVRKEPKGAVLVIGTWNYPIQTVLNPTIAAIAAGNTVIIKPSEFAPHSIQVLTKYLSRYVNPDAVCIINGGPEETTLLLGRIVMRAAANHLTPCSLELGGKSPAIILDDENLNMDIVANRLVWGKFTNTGQICIAVDYLIVSERHAEELISKLVKCIKKTFLYNSTEQEQSQDEQQTSSFSNYLCRIINHKHFDRLEKLVAKVTEQDILYGGKQFDRDELYIEPTLVSVHHIKGSPLMDEEIFGPILPILVVPDTETAVSLLRQRDDTPLAMYIFGENKEKINYVLGHVPSGNVCINDTLMQASELELPFGGSGTSGMGRYHGKSGFDELSNHRGMMICPFSRLHERMMEARYPPFTESKYIFNHVYIVGLFLSGTSLFKTLFAFLKATWDIYF